MTRCPIVFDLDGTLIDSAPSILAAANLVLHREGAAPLTLDQLRRFIGGGVELLWTRIIAARGLAAGDRGRLVAAFLTRYHETTAQTRPYPGVAEALGVLADDGHPLGICTNKPLAATRDVLDHLGLAHLFGAVIGGDSLSVRKPDPAPLRAAFAALGRRTPPFGLFVGDSEYDAGCAAAAGVPLLLFTEGYRQAPVDDLPHAARFDHFGALPDLVAGQLDIFNK